MLSVRLVASLSLILCSFTSATAAEKYTLQDRADPGQIVQYQLGLQLNGQVQIKSGAKTISLDLKATGQHRFVERALTVTEAGRATRVARHYDQALADIVVHGAPTKRSLRSDRKLLVGQTTGHRTTVYSPHGPLTREELELTGEHLDVLALAGALPPNPVGAGDTWEPATGAVQALFALDGLIQHSIQGKLESVTGETAQVSLKGQVIGIARGSEVTIELVATLKVDLKANRIVAASWKQKDDRRQGPIDPAAKTEAVITMERTFGASSDALADDVVGKLPAEPVAAQLLLSYRDPKSTGELYYDRSWYVVAQNEQYAVFRLLERGELIGQMNVTPLPKVAAGQHVTPEELKQQVERTPGFVIDQVVQAGVVQGEPGHWLYRLSVAGRAADLDVLQNYYAVAGPQGNQLLLSFTTELANVERFGNRDLSIVGTVTFRKE